MKQYILFDNDEISKMLCGETIEHTMPDGKVIHFMSKEAFDREMRTKPGHSKWRSKQVPTLVVTFLNWISEDEFVGLYRGGEILCHKNHWEEVVDED